MIARRPRESNKTKKYKRITDFKTKELKEKIAVLKDEAKLYENELATSGIKCRSMQSDFNYLERENRLFRINLMVKESFLLKQHSLIHL